MPFDNVSEFAVIKFLKLSTLVFWDKGLQPSCYFSKNLKKETKKKQKFMSTVVHQKLMMTVMDFHS